jgi:hypothetical protein
MFGSWLRKTKNKQVDAETLPSKMIRTIGVYNSLLNTYPNHVIDVSWLPANKETMAQLFKMIITSGEQYGNSEHRKTTEAYWRLLSHFQPGVGSVPIDIEISKDNPTVAVWTERAERVIGLLEAAIAEGERYEREIERLRQQHRR